MKEFIEKLNQDPIFREIIAREVAPGIPEIPAYNGENTEQWKSQSMMRQGYILCLQKFGVTLEEIENG